MSIPGTSESSTPVIEDYIPPDGRVPFNPLIDYEKGGVGLSDPSQGLQVQDWRCFYQGGFIKISDSSGATTNILEIPGVVWVSFTFDQNMQPAITYVTDDGVARLYWFDVTIPGYDTLEFPGATFPRLCMDEKRGLATGISDMILAYIYGDDIRYRRQRDRFLTEFVFKAGGMTGRRLERVGMHAGNRLQFEVRK